MKLCKNLALKHFIIIRKDEGISFLVFVIFIGRIPGLFFFIIIGICILVFNILRLIVMCRLDIDLGVHIICLFTISNLGILRYRRISQLRLWYCRNIEDGRYGRYRITTIPETPSVCKRNSFQQLMSVRDGAHVITDGLLTGPCGTGMLQIAMNIENRVFRDSNQLHLHEMSHHPLHLYLHVDMLMG